MKCPHEHVLSRALAEGFPPELQAHVDSCLACSTYVADHGAIGDLVAQLPVIEPDASRAANVRASLLAAARAPAPLARPWRAWALAFSGMVAAAAVLALVVLRRAPAPSSAQAHYRATILPHDGAAVMRTSPAPDETIRLVDGTATITVAALEPGERVRVLTADAELVASDTAFDVTAEHDRLQALRVVKGHVEVRAAGATPRRVVAGERWEVQLGDQAGDNGSAHIATAATPDTTDELSTGDTHVASATSNENEVGTATADAHGASTATTRTTPSAAEHVGTATTAKHVGTTSLDKQRATTASGAAGKAGADQPSTTNKQLTASGGSGPAASQARPRRQIELLFEQGWAALAAGKAADAAVAFERAAQAAPDDPLAEDAWFWRASALARAKSPAAAAALESFLARYPHTPRVGEASAMLGWLVIDRDLDRAEKLFHAAENDRVAAVRASATKGLAAVAQRRKR
jgi:TolA-binding protein